MTMLKSVVVSFLLLFSVGCVSKTVECDCAPPGPALVKLFIASDGIPDSNIGLLDVYPGQQVFFEGLDEFYLIFEKDPTNPDGIERVFKSKDGKVEFTISEDYAEVLRKQRSSNKEGKFYHKEYGYFENPEVNSVFIKYKIKANGKLRDPGVRIIER